MQYASVAQGVTHWEEQMHDWSASASVAPAGYSVLQLLWQVVFPAVHPDMHVA